MNSALFVFVLKVVFVLYSQLVTEENVRGVVTLNEEWELEDFCNTEDVSIKQIHCCLYCRKNVHAMRSVGIQPSPLGRQCLAIKGNSFSHYTTKTKSKMTVQRVHIKVNGSKVHGEREDSLQSVLITIL